MKSAVRIAVTSICLIIGSPFMILGMIWQIMVAGFGTGRELLSDFYEWAEK